MPIKKEYPKLLPHKRRLRSNQTTAEQLLWGKLRGKHIPGVKFSRQHGIGPYVVDFFCPERELVVEVDGDVYTNTRQETKDQQRDLYLQSLGLTIIRYTNDEIFKNLDGVLEDLIQCLFGDSTSPLPGIVRPGGRHHGLPRKGNTDNLLPRAFYERQTLKVAQELLGKALLRQTPDRLIETRIVDVEAYVGPEDKACHASKGRTKRTAVMFGPAGYTYVYMIYGMYHCLNVVTEQVDYPAAILIRGLEVLETHPSPDIKPTRIDGPGRVCRFLNLDRTHNVLDVTKGEVLWVEDRGFCVSKAQIQALPRIGVDYAGEWAKKLWRFCLPAPPSSRTRHAPRR